MGAIIKINNFLNNYFKINFFQLTIDVSSEWGSDRRQELLLTSCPMTCQTNQGERNKQEYNVLFHSADSPGTLGLKFQKCCH